MSDVAGGHLPDPDPSGDRQPTSHERLAHQPWEDSYRDGAPPWDIGAPQPAFVALGAAGGFAGDVLDAGCGTGQNALYVASHGLHVVGVDVAPTAIAAAAAAAASRGLDAEFLLADALHLDRLRRTFDTVLDCGLFHTFDGDERRAYVSSLAAVTGPGARVYVLCFSDVGEGVGPHPVSRAELTGAFSADGGWTIVSVAPDRIETRFERGAVPAWLLSVERAA